MSNDLVKRLREYAQVAHMAAAWGFAGEGFVMEKAADRIEELEYKLARAAEDLKAIAHVCVGDARRCGSKAALEDLTGGKDE